MNHIYDPSFVEMTAINQPLIKFTDQTTYEALSPFLKLVLVSIFFVVQHRHSIPKSCLEFSK